jgi:hypothetical protein
VGVLAVARSLDDVGAATLAAAADSGLELRLDGRTASLLLFRYVVDGVEYTIATVFAPASLRCHPGRPQGRREGEIPY